MSEIDDLVDDVFGDRRAGPYRHFEQQLRASRRLQAFVTQHRTKIRAKLKNARATARP